MKKTLIIVIAVAAAIGIASFFGGMTYAEGKTPRGGFGMGGDMSGFPGAADRQQLGQRDGTRVGGSMGGGNMIIGEIIAADGQSVTVKSQDGGSVIAFVSETTTISRCAAGTADDLAVGETIMISGLKGADGSITAKSIQLDPVMPEIPISEEVPQP